MMTKKKRKKIILSTIFLLINVVIVIFIARYFFKDASTNGIQQIFGSWAKHWYFVLFALLCPIIALFAESMKFFIMIGKRLKKHRLSVSIKTAIFGKYYDNVTPLGTGGQPFQIMYLYKYGISGPDSSLMPVASFVMNQFAFVTIAITVFITGSQFVTIQALRISAYIGSFFMIAMPVVVLFFTLFPVISRKVSVGILIFLHRIKLVKDVDHRIQKIDYFIVRFKTSFKQMSQAKGVMLSTFLLSLVYQVAMFSIPFFVILALGMNVSYLEMAILCVFIYSAIAYIPTPGNSGGAEFSFALLFESIGLLYYEVFWSMLLWRFSSYFFIILIGLSTILFDTIYQHRHPINIPERERHKVIYPVATLKDCEPLFPKTSI